MKHLKYLVRLGVAFGFCISTTAVQAKMFKPANDNQFNRILSRSELALVLFYKKDNLDLKKDFASKQIRTLKNAFIAASHDEPMVNFICVNVSHEKLLRTARMYYATSEQPLFMLFYRGKPFKSGFGSIVEKNGYLTKDEIIDFVEEHFAQEINRIVIRERQRDERRAKNVRWDSGWYAGGYGPYYNGYEYSNYWWGNGYFPSW